MFLPQKWAYLHKLFLIQYLRVFAKDMKHVYTTNIQFGGSFKFGTQHTMSTLTFKEQKAAKWHRQHYFATLLAGI